MRKKRSRYEELEQSHFFQWLWNHFPKEKQLLIFAIPNGGNRPKEEYITKSGERKKWCPEGAKLKRLGVVKGVLDIFVSIPRFPYHGLYIEFKSPDQSLSKEQSAFKIAAENYDYKCVVVYSYLEAKLEIKKYFGGTFADV
jgi:hypothetical protein